MTGVRYLAPVPWTEADVNTLLYRFSLGEGADKIRHTLSNRTKYSIAKKITALKLRRNMVPRPMQARPVAQPRPQPVLPGVRTIPLLPSELAALAEALQGEA